MYKYIDGKMKFQYIVSDKYSMDVNVELRHSINVNELNTLGLIRKPVFPYIVDRNEFT